jgi:hypothetical protein
MYQQTARSIATVACNPRCHRQAALHLLGVSEQEAYALLTNSPYPGPRGERTAALQWGRLFEARLAENHARRLLACLDGVIGFQAASATVCDLRLEVSGTQPGAVVERRRRTHAILEDLLAHRPVPDLLLQPPLLLSWGGEDWGVIVPDGLVRDRTQGVYLPLECKGFISIDGMATSGERTAMRLQAAVEVLALRAELARLDSGHTIPPQALLVLATPYGFVPAPVVLEELEAELAAVKAALRTLGRVASHVATRQQSASTAEKLTQLSPFYQESCLTGCALAEHCRLQAPGVRGEVGDHAASLVGENLDLARVTALLSGEPPATPDEANLVQSLEEMVTLFQWNAS